MPCVDKSTSRVICRVQRLPLSLEWVWSRGKCHDAYDGCEDVNVVTTRAVGGRPYCSRQGALNLRDIGILLMNGSSLLTLFIAFSSFVNGGSYFVSLYHWKRPDHHHMGRIMKFGDFLVPLRLKRQCFILYGESEETQPS